MELSYGGLQHKEFVVSSASTTWTINHNMGFNPSIDVRANVNGKLTKVYPTSLEFKDTNTIVIKWSVARFGSVLLATSQV